jgi:hypothetical protein
LRDVLQSVAQGAGFVFAGAAMAPNHQRNVAFVLAGAATCLSVLVVLYALSRSAWYGALMVVCTAIAAVLTAIHGSYEEYAQREPRLPSNL